MRNIKFLRQTGERPRMPPTSLLRLAVGNIAVFLGLLLGLLFLLSLGGDIVNTAKSFFPKTDSRAALPVYDNHEYARQIYNDQRKSIKGYVPFSEWRHSAFKSQTLTVDENGWRTHGSGTANAPDAQTIGFYGSSTLWGTGVDDNSTIPAFFDALTSDYIVTNRSERGYTIMQNLTDLITEISEGRAPKIVVFYGGFNDIAVHCNLAITTGLNGHLAEKRISSALLNTDDEGYLYQNLIAPILSIVSRLVAPEDDRRIPGCSNDPQRAEAVAEAMVSRLEIMNQIVSNAGGRFYAFLQPTAYSGSPDVSYLKLDTDDDFLFENAEVKSVLPLLKDKLSRGAHGWYTDLTDAFDGKNMLLIDDVHASPAGNRLIAARIRETLDGTPTDQ